MKSFTATWLLAVFLVVCCPYSAQALADQESAENASLPEKSLYHLRSQWKNQDMKSVGLASLQGQPVIMAMVYTQCKEACPMILHVMMQIEEDLFSNASPPIKFVLVSFDSQRDTPRHLKDYARENGLDTRRWTLLQGKSEAVQELAATLGVQYRRKKSGDFDHANVVSLLDANGVLVAQHVGLQEGIHLFEDKAKALLTR